MSYPPERPGPLRTEQSDRTMMSEAPAFTASGRAWRPYRFRGLEPVPKSALLLTERLLELVPVQADLLAQAVTGRVRELFDVDAQLRLDHVHVVSPRELGRKLQLPSFLAVLASAPHQAKGLLEIELALAHATVDVVLGGSGAGDTVALRPLTEVEEGMMGYVVLEALRALSPSIEPGLPKLRFGGQVHTLDEAMAVVGEEEYLLVLQLKGALGAHSGFVRLFIPGSLGGLTSPLPEGRERTLRRRARVAEGMGRLAGVSTHLRAEIGRALVSLQDLAGVRLKDVVLVDECTARPDLGEGGTAHLKVGAGRTGYLEAQILVEDGRLLAKVERFVPGEAPRLLEDVAGPGGEPPARGPLDAPAGLEKRDDVDSIQNEGSELLNDIPLQVAVELARVPLTAEQVVSLKVGQVVELGRSAGEPVELSVNGRIVARGELVEVDGHLGVRVLAIVG